MKYINYIGNDESWLHFWVYDLDISVEKVDNLCHVVTMPIYEDIIDTYEFHLNSPVYLFLCFYTILIGLHGPSPWWQNSNSNLSLINQMVEALKFLFPRFDERDV